jgi:putative aminopeptidase FrvX
MALFLVCGSVADAQLQFEVVKEPAIRKRLDDYHGSDLQRENTLKKMFEVGGCPQLSEQPVPHLKEPNLICTLPGESDSRILMITAHFDYVRPGDGVVDDWSGASLLPSLFEALNHEKTKHTVTFVAFAGETRGMIGSKFYASGLTPEEQKRIAAVVNLEALGLGAPEVWAGRSDVRLTNALTGIATAMKMTVMQVSRLGFGGSDAEPFRRTNIPTITLFSPIPLAIYHNPANDTRSEIDFQEYYKMYRLLSAYLTFLDTNIKTN